MLNELEIVEGDKMIADFMGLRSYIKYNPIGNNEVLVVYQSKTEWDLSKYHTSLDWLMPVIEKIKNMGYNVEVVLTKEYSACRIYRGKDKTIPSACIIGKEAYETVIQFIKWHNSKEREVEHV